MQDIGTSPEAVALQATITAAPDDVAPQLVLADLLLSADDPRGELIVLDRREREGDLVDPDALERLLELAAIFGFPRAEPEEPPAPFIRDSATSYVLRHHRIYRLLFRPATVTYGALTYFADDIERATWQVSLGSSWTLAEGTQIAHAFGDMIREDTPLERFRPPFAANPLPQFPGAAIRCYVLPKKFTNRRGVPPSRYGLAARDYRRWMTLWGQLGRSRAFRDQVTSPASSG